MSTTPTLARRLGTADAVFIGLGSMIGAGVFAAFAPAAQAAGAGLLVGLVVAAVVATCNALASAQLAATYPTSGGTYVYGRERLGPWWGYLAGWSFVIGKTASCAAMALTFASYAVPAAWQRPVALVAVLALAAVNYRGVTRTAQLARVIVVLVLAALAVAVVASGASGLPHLGELGGSTVAGGGAGGASSATGAGGGAGGVGGADGGLFGAVFAAGPYGILQSAGLLFFAFAGYARIATMGEEVRNPQRTIPRAIVIALSVAIVVYAVVGVTLLGTLGPAALAASSAPVRDAAVAGGWTWAAPVVTVGAALAALGALLALIAGIGRTTLAMAREGDLPRWLAAVHPRFQVPHRAELVLAVVIGMLVLTLDLRGAIGFSSFGVLLYYFIANLSAFSQGRRRALYVVGALGCLTLVATLPWPSILGGVAVLAVGVVWRLLRRGRRLSDGSGATRD